jgi:catechol 2,3-dioxygenase-like lactoylglutathione lyase family enzyme
MACRITELVQDSRDPERLAAFWCEVLGYVVLERLDGSVEIGPPDAGFGGPQPTVVFSPTDEPRRGKLRLHIDVNATDRDQEAELQRLLAAGAVPVDIGQTGTESWHVLADPEGNEFCLLRRQVAPV